MPAAIRLLATDLDGTLIGSANELPAYAELHSMVEHLREVHGMTWVACTGRTFRSFREFFTPMRRTGILPDYVVIRHAYLFRLTRFGFIPHLSWNVVMLLDLWREVRDGKRAMQHWYETIMGRSTGVRVLRRQAGRLNLRFDSDESAQVAADYISKEALKFRHLCVYVTQRDVDVRFVPATKGMALRELAKRLGIPRQEILAIGNGQNDLSMLDAAVAGMTGCPSNSEEGVRAAVHAAGGHLARQRSLFGVLEVLAAYDTDMVNSEPQEGETLHGPKAERHAQKERRRVQTRKRRGKSPALVFTGIALVAIIALASVGVLPGSRGIMRPVEFIFGLLARLIPF